MTTHQQKQIEIIDGIEKQVLDHSVRFSIVTPVSDFENDPRICLTSVHFPKQELIQSIIDPIIAPLRKIEPSYYYYPATSLHMTIKNIRVIHDPPTFTPEDITKAEKVFANVIPKHTTFNVYFYRLLLLPNNLALIGTTDPELDNIIRKLNGKLKEAGIPDDKKYTNSKYFFSNMTLARFPEASEKFRKKIGEISDTLTFKPYTVDSVTLITGNATFNKRTVIHTWELR